MSPDKSCPDRLYSGILESVTVWLTKNTSWELKNVLAIFERFFKTAFTDLWTCQLTQKPQLHLPLHLRPACFHSLEQLIQTSISWWGVSCGEPDEWCTSLRGTCSISQEKATQKPPLNQILRDSTHSAGFLFSRGASAINSKLFSFSSRHTPLLPLC